MVLKIFTKEDGPESREATELGERIAEENNTVEYFDADDYATTQYLDLYDIHTFPAVLVSTEDGKQIELWQGELPTESEIKNFLRL